MSPKRLIITFAAVATLALLGAPWAQAPADDEGLADPPQADLLAREAAQAEAEATQAVQAAQAAEEYKLLKMNEATTADDTFHANRTEARVKTRGRWS